MIIEHIGSCLEFLSAKLCHREISPSNILWFRDGGYKLADVSICNLLEPGREQEEVHNGAPAYNSNAFSVKFKRNGTAKYVGRDFSADELLSEDVFHFGLTLFQAILGITQADLIRFRKNDEKKFPYKTIKERIVQQFQDAGQCPYTEYLPDYLGQLIKRVRPDFPIKYVVFIKKMLMPRFEERITIQDLNRAFRNLQNSNTDKEREAMQIIADCSLNEKHEEDKNLLDSQFSGSSSNLSEQEQ